MLESQRDLEEDHLHRPRSLSARLAANLLEDFHDQVSIAIHLVWLQNWMSHDTRNTAGHENAQVYTMNMGDVLGLSHASVTSEASAAGLYNRRFPGLRKLYCGHFAHPWANVHWREVCAVDSRMHWHESAVESECWEVSPNYMTRHTGCNEGYSEANLKTRMLEAVHDGLE